MIYIKTYEYELIDKFLKDKGLEHLKCKQLYQRKYSEVVAILNLFLNLPEEQKKLFMPLLTSNIWHSNLENVRAIFDIFSNLREERESLFKPLLTSTIWNSNPENVRAIFDIFSNLREEQESLFKPLLTSNIWKSNPKNVSAIFDIFSNLTKEQKEVFMPLLTSNIWNSNPENIKAIIESKIWENNLYRKLLTKSIWNKSITKIEKIIETIEKLKLEKYITASCLNLSPIQIKALYHYMKCNNIPAIIDGKLNPLFNLAPSLMLKRYRVNLKELVERELESGLSK